MLEMFERLLAALIILALLVLVMFIALPETGGGGRSVTAPLDPVGQVTTPVDSEKVKSPEAVPEKTAETEAAPAPQPPEKPAAGAPDVKVPNPPAGKVAETEPKVAPPTDKAVPPTDKIVRDNPGGVETKPKQKFVKTHPDRLPASTELEPIVTKRVDKPAAVEKPKPGKPKSDKLRIERSRTETAFRAPVTQRVERHVVVRSERIQDDGIGEYIRRTDTGPPDWHRTHYHECTDGRCECACDRPYWANSDAPCFD